MASSRRRVGFPWCVVWRLVLGSRVAVVSSRLCLRGCNLVGFPCPFVPASRGSSDHDGTSYHRRSLPESSIVLFGRLPRTPQASTAVFQSSLLTCPVLRALPPQTVSEQLLCVPPFGSHATAVSAHFRRWTRAHRICRSHSARTHAIRVLEGSGQAGCPNRMPYRHFFGRRLK